MPEYTRFKPNNKERSINSNREAARRTNRRKWLKKQANFKISDSPLDNRV